MGVFLELYQLVLRQLCLTGGRLAHSHIQSFPRPEATHSKHRKYGEQQSDRCLSRFLIELCPVCTSKAVLKVLPFKATHKEILFLPIAHLARLLQPSSVDTRYEVAQAEYGVVCTALNSIERGFLSA